MFLVWFAFPSSLLRSQYTPGFYLYLYRRRALFLVNRSGFISFHYQQKISAKTREKYSQVMNNIRTRISFEIMRSVLVAVRGVRGKIRQAMADPIASIAFNLIPEARSYECP